LSALAGFLTPELPSAPDALADLLLKLPAG
jgi:hypothetical protein